MTGSKTFVFCFVYFNIMPTLKKKKNIGDLKLIYFLLCIRDLGNTKEVASANKSYTNYYSNVKL